MTKKKTKLEKKKAVKREDTHIHKFQLNSNEIKLEWTCFFEEDLNDYVVWVLLIAN